MISSFKQYLNEAERVLKTQKGSRIARYKWGVGKEIGGFVYLHRRYLSSLPKDRQKIVTEGINIVEKLSYNIIKIHHTKPIVSFFNSLDFNTADEPIAGKYINVNTETKKITRGETKAIYHHKWLWVKDRYNGFNVQQSFERSKLWLQIPDIKFSEIGKKETWLKKYVPQIEKLKKDV